MSLEHSGFSMFAASVCATNGTYIYVTRFAILRFSVALGFWRNP